MPDREKVIKGIQECDLNGGLIGNCPYKEIVLLLKEQEAMLKKACECILSGSSWETVCCTLTDKSQMNDDDWCDKMDCNTDEPVPIECAMHYLETES